MKFSFYLLASFALGLIPNLSHAQSWVATGTGPFSWTDGANWSGGTFPNGATNAVFSNAANASSFQVDVNSPISIGALIFNSNQTGNVTLGGTNSLTLTSDTPAVQVDGGPVSHTINIPIILGAGVNTRQFAVNSGTLTLNGNVAESGGARTMSKAGAGTLILAGENTFTGGMNIFGGSVYVNNSNTTTGSGTGSGLVFVTFGATIRGTGRISGSLSVFDGLFGTTPVVAPGTPAGVGNLTCGGSVDLGPGSALVVRLNGASDGTYDRLTSAGNVALTGNPTLNASIGGGYTPVIGDKLFIVVNSGAGTTTGTFNGLAEGATVNLSGFNFTIHYGANFEAPGLPLSGGNDIALVPVPEPATCLGLAALGGLVLRSLRRRAGA